MKKDIIIEKKNSGGNVEVSIFRKNKLEVRYIYKEKDEYNHPMLSLENLSYYIANLEEDEEDDYLLYHALQEGKKPFVSMFTRNADDIVSIFKDDERYSYSVNEFLNEYKLVHIARNACLADFFDIDEVIDWFENSGNRIGLTLYDGVLSEAMNMPIIDLADGKLTTLGKYDYIMRLESPFDDCLNSYKATGIVIAAMLLGYPFEAALNLIEHVAEHLY